MTYEYGSNWDWDSPELRTKLKLGMILETYDCGYLEVQGITEEGILSRSFNLDAEDHEPSLWTWEAMKRIQMTIYEGPR